MKKFFTLSLIFALALTACDQPSDNNNPDSGLQNITIRNQSSYDLTNVKFSGTTFATSGSNNELQRNTNATKPFAKTEANQAGYISFTRKDIGITLRTASRIPFSDYDYVFSITNDTVVQEQDNPANQKALTQIDFLPKIALAYNGGINIPKNDVVNIGEIVVNDHRQTEFTILNNGLGKLRLDGSEPVKLSNTSGVFLVFQPEKSEIESNGSLTFTLNSFPATEQNYVTTVTIKSNDPNGDFTFIVTVKGVPPKPIAAVLFDGHEISQDGTIDAGTVLITLSKDITVTIKNEGTLLLTLDTANIAITGDDDGVFAKTTNPGINISAGGQTSFIIKCAPVKTGENHATLIIPTNDDDRNPIIVFLQVTGEKGSAVLALSQGSIAISNNSITPFDFGRVELGANKPLIFTIKNTGNIALVLTGTPEVASSNTAFTVLAQPANKTIAPGSDVSFVIQYTPTEEKDDVGTLTILNNSDSMIFIANIKGTGYIKRPEITVKQGNTVINQHGEYNLGNVMAEKTLDITFTIENSGEEDLTFIVVGDNTISLTDNVTGFYSIIYQPFTSMVITPGGSTIFIIRFSPTSVGNNYVAAVQIKTNSRVNNEFSFWVMGNSTNTYQIGDIGPAGGLIFYDKGFYSEGWQYLEAAPSIAEFTTQWGAYNTTVGGTMQIVGAGKQNTQIIVNTLNARGESGRAAQLCASMVFGGCNDWFLPSRNELDLMYQNLYRKNLGGFTTTSGGNTQWYWSSSEYSYSNAYCQTFYSGTQSTSSKGTTTYRVRAIRSF